LQGLAAGTARIRPAFEQGDAHARVLLRQPLVTRLRPEEVRSDLRQSEERGDGGDVFDVMIFRSSKLKSNGQIDLI
jgi:hypothetical protein